MHLVLDTILQVVKVIAAQGMYQKGGAPNVECRFFTSDCIFQDGSRIGSLSNKVWNEHDHLQTSGARNTLRHPSSAVVDTQLNTTINDWSHVIRVTLPSSKIKAQGLEQIIGHHGCSEYSSPSSLSDHIPQFQQRFAKVPPIPSTANGAPP